MRRKNTKVSNMSWPDLVMEFFRNRWMLFTALMIIGVGTLVYVRWIKAPVLVSRIEQKCPTWSLTGRLVTGDGKYYHQDGARVGVYSGPFTADDKIHNGVFRITGVRLPTDGFIQLFLETGGRRRLIYRQPVEDNRHLIDSAKCLISFIEDLIVDTGGLKSEHHPVASSPSPSLFSIDNTGMDVLKAHMKNSGLPYSSRASNLRIRIDYSGTIEEISNNLYRYNGGVVCVYLNDKACGELPALEIAPTFSGGNSLDFVKHHLNKEVSSIAETNLQIVTQTIRKCIGL